MVIDPISVNIFVLLDMVPLANYTLHSAIIMIVIVIVIIYRNS